MKMQYFSQTAQTYLDYDPEGTGRFSYPDLMTWRVIDEEGNILAVGWLECLHCYYQE